MCFVLFLINLLFTGQHLGFCSRGGQNSCFHIPVGGGKRYMLHAVQYNIYSKISRGGQTSSKGGEGGENAPPPK